MSFRFAMILSRVVLPHIMPPALVVTLMYGLHEQQLLHATTTELVGRTGILAVVLMIYVVLCLLRQTPRNIIFDSIAKELCYGYHFVIFWKFCDMSFRSDAVVDDVKVALIIAVGISLRPKAYPRSVLVFAAWNMQQTCTAILLWQWIQSSHASYPRFVDRSDEHPNPWATAVLGSTIGSILSGTIAVLLWYFGPRARNQQHARDVEATGAQTNRAGLVTGSHRQEREAAILLAMGDTSEAQQTSGTEMNDVPPIPVDAGIQGRRPFPCAHLPRPRISVDEETEGDRSFPSAHLPRPRISVDEET